MMENNNKSVRRVGTFTMGLYLIVIGIIAIFAVFQPNFDFLFLLKLTPVVFILLGIEVLIYHFALKTEKIKYDIFSIFICFILICATICTACIPWALSFFGPEREIKINQLQSEMYDICYDKLKDNKDILKIEVNTYPINRMSNFPELTINDTYTYLNVTLKPSLTNTTEFANTCKTILETLNNSSIKLKSIDFDLITREKEISLDISDKFAMNLDAVSLESLVEVEERN